MKINTVIEAGFFYGATPDTFDKAKQLRNNLTDAEKKLWDCLSMRKIFGLHFRQQHPINRFIADFYCHKVKLVIEVDGGIHSLQNRREYDQGRDYFMRELGLHVMRFKNEDIESNMEVVVAEIKKRIKEITPNVLP